MRANKDRIRKHRSRFIWAWFHGEWHKGEVDHINRNKTDDRIENLRVITHSENNINRDSYRDFPKYIYKHPQTDGYKVGITVSKKSIHIAYKKTLEEAIKARDEWLKKNDPVRFKCLYFLPKQSHPTPS